MDSKFGNINIFNEYYDLEEDQNKSRQHVLEEFERRKKARQIAVAVDDVEVKTHLRHLNEPICLFGEGPADRRERLRNLLAKLGEDAIKKKKEEEKGIFEKDRDPSSTWYHEGPQSLKEARIWIADYSIPRAKNRLDRARAEKLIPESIRSATRQDLYKKLRSMEISCSQVGDTRPISYCQFSPDCSLVATSSWSGLCKLWSKENLEHVRTLRGHNGNVCSIVFNPYSTLNLPKSVINLASCGTDGSVNLWNLESEEPIGNLEGHEPHRVSRLAFHPSGRYLATCCSDKSWRLWDLEVKEEVLYQEGHSKAVYDIAFHPDGSLAASCGLDAFGRVWDLRTGRCIMFMDGHLKEILSICISPNGYQIVTGSMDHTVKIWNLRERKCEYTLPSHINIVSKVLFEKNNGNYIVTASYDNSVKIWAHSNWTPIQTLNGHDNKVMCVDVSPDNHSIITCSYDRTFKLWTSQ